MARGIRHNRGGGGVAKLAEQNGGNGNGRDNTNRTVIFIVAIVGSGIGAATLHFTATADLKATFKEQLQLVTGQVSVLDNSINRVERRFEEEFKGLRNYIDKENEDQDDSIDSKETNLHDRINEVERISQEVRVKAERNDVAIAAAMRDLSKLYDSLVRLEGESKERALRWVPEITRMQERMNATPGSSAGSP